MEPESFLEEAPNKIYFKPPALQRCMNLMNFVQKVVASVVYSNGKLKSIEMVVR